MITFSAYREQRSERNTASQRAHAAVGKALREGRLQRGQCALCDPAAPLSSIIHGHHEDYSRPLDVVWLCHIHHRRLHAERIREMKAAEQAALAEATGRETRWFFEEEAA